jgi:hypothetical protein
MKITKLLNQIKEKLFVRNIYFNLTNKNKSNNCELKIDNTIKPNINNKARNKYGFPNI